MALVSEGGKEIETTGLGKITGVDFNVEDVVLDGEESEDEVAVPMEEEEEEEGEDVVFVEKYFVHGDDMNMLKVLCNGNNWDVVKLRQKKLEGLLDMYG